MRGIFVALLMLMGSFQLTADNVGENDSRKRYIQQWKNEAMKQMKVHGIPASITLAQGILESRSGQSELTVKSNNHFGIKCHSTWKGKKVYADDDKKNECFRKYKNAGQSFEDHSQFLLKKRYAGLFELKKSDYKGWAKGLKKAGYATDPAYARLLIKLIEDNELYKYDKMVLKGKYQEPIEEEPAEEIVLQETKSTKHKTTVREGTTVINLVKSYNVRLHKNNIKYIVANGGESVETVADILDLGHWQLTRYNDLGSRKILKEGEQIFIQPKRNSAAQGSHKVQSGDTLLSISQSYGVKLNKLVKYNNIEADSKLKTGSTIKLKKK